MVSVMKEEFLSLFKINECTVLLLVPVVFDKEYYTGPHWHISVVFVVFLIFFHICIKLQDNFIYQGPDCI